ncbi:hypothetical protein GCK72_003162 [Caenorhabditis remanei]|uniref:F-box domain-containing protein n=1 Tax=Caenorhabditis remanei TaxID=31234 RepID=A0A6A5HWP6_CAERE|nr:hypothetical protein GCK72_003162 [Caenorhabditis remanei]KAF1771336.1 hypothetical protein GCK72_003162 [Caenorhabditis remanei]
MSSSFPLLRLPRLVLCEIFKSLNIEEKIKLSFCSRKISTQIYNARLYSQKVIVDLNMVYQGIKVCSENYRDSIKISTYPDFWKRHNSNTEQFSIECRGFLSAIEHLLKIFQCKFSTTICHCDSDLYQPTISMLFDLQVEFKKLIIELNGSKNQILLWNQISKKFELIEDVVIFSAMNQFTPVFASWPQNIGITNSAWFTLEYFLACTSTRIILDGSHLGNEDLDIILKNWKTGGFRNLNYLRIHSQRITNIGAIILGMSLSELEGKVIQTDDGLKKATITTSFQSIEMSVTRFE